MKCELILLFLLIKRVTMLRSLYRDAYINSYEERKERGSLFHSCSSRLLLCRSILQALRRWGFQSFRSPVSAPSCCFISSLLLCPGIMAGSLLRVTLDCSFVNKILPVRPLYCINRAIFFFIDRNKTPRFCRTFSRCLGYFSFWSTGLLNSQTYT